MQKSSSKSKKSTPAGSMGKDYKTTVKNTSLTMDIECDEEPTESFQAQALEVRQPGADFDPAAEPQNGEEFLMQMMHERKKCPSVVVKRPKSIAGVVTAPKYMQGKVESELQDCSYVCLRPTPEWKDVQVADFVTARAKIALMRSELDAQNYDNKLEVPLTSDPQTWQPFCRDNEPLLSTVLRISQRSLEQLLHMLCEWLHQGADPLESNVTCVDEDEQQQQLASPTVEVVASSSSAAAANSALPFDLSSSQQWLGSWLYATLACLQLPLEPDVHSTLRDIARNCIRLRNRLLEQEVEKAVPYNLFIYLIAQVFDQLDFKEFV